MYRKLGAKMVVGMPFKDQATSDTLFLPQIPPSSDKNGRRALKRLQVKTTCCVVCMMTLGWIAANMAPHTFHVFVSLVLFTNLYFV